jgi:heme A synthase
MILVGLQTMIGGRAVWYGMQQEGLRVQLAGLLMCVIGLFALKNWHRQRR